MKTISKKAGRTRAGQMGAKALHNHQATNGAIRNVVVIGGSAGGIKSLCEVMRNLPGKVSAPILAVLHMSEGANRLPQVLQRCGSTEIVVPDPAEPMLPGRLYLPLPNHHLIVRNGCVGTVMGPRESRHRPSVNTLFRCVARAYRSKVIGVILSGALDDGTAGALAVNARGGTLIVEDPATAEVADMPRNVMLAVKPDYCLPVGQIAGVLCELLNGANGKPKRNGRAPTRSACVDEMTPPERDVEPQGITCPECGGYLAEMGNGKTKQFRCHVGHTFSMESLSEGHADALERALWIALRKLNEQHAIQVTLAQTHSDAKMRERFNENAAAAKADMEKLHEIISRL
jgi:two-component system chemotaxis response regulator CheB